MEREEREIVTTETLIRQVEELLLMDHLSEEEKVEILQNVLSILDRQE
jgi:hypothetical protein